jgi:hypothetical protein
MNGPFRIRKPITIKREGSEDVTTGDEYLARLVKLIPSEVIAIYMAGLPLAKSWPGTWSFVCLILVLIARIFGTREPGKNVQWISVAVSFMSFIIWIYASGSFFFHWTLDQNIAALAVLVWTFLVPFFHKGD